MSLDSANSTQADEQSLTKIAELVHKEAGLVISPSKFAMVRSRLRGRLRALNLNGLDEYCALVGGPMGHEERAEMISALTTNVSSFFRESHHFDKLQTDVLPTLANKLKAGGRVRIWSAGCSTGEEPTSIAMLVTEFDPVFASGDFRILASDIDPQVLQKSKLGNYTETQMSGVNPARRNRFFTSQEDEQWSVTPELRKLISFRQLNLLHDWPMRGKFDVIFCRNVVIYFNQDTQSELWPRFADMLHTGGRMFVGHSERIVDPQASGFEPSGTTEYTRTDGQTHRDISKRTQQKWH